MELSESLKTKLDQLIGFLSNKKVVVAFSGGVDSSVLAYITSQYAAETILITEVSILYPNEEVEEAIEFARNYGITHMALKRDPLKDQYFVKNPKERCYICKKGLYEKIKKVMASRRPDLIIDGTNLDDLSDYRPGLRALEELNISTPYIKFKISKQEIREIAKYYKLEVSSKPSMACFSSRIPYGQEISEKKLYQIREGEKFLKETFKLTQLRVRYHEGPLARIELLPEEFSLVLNEEGFSLIKKRFKDLGFNYVTLDVEGYRSGSMNEIL
ncbi:MAG: ATP-dependent sacrificial sulfur transferase LarE [Promethearchaeota archaeon]